MSATLRYDIGPALSAAIREYDWLLLGVFGEKHAERWPGIHKARRGEYWQCTTFAVKLPRDVKNAWTLLEILCKLRDQPSPLVRKGANVLASKLATSLGLPFEPRAGDETGFLVGIAARPEELTTWSAYADWLQEQDDEDSIRRGEMIYSWLVKKAAKVKYGVIQSERDDRLSPNRYQAFQWHDELVALFPSALAQ